MGMDKNTLQISTLGRFEVKIGGKRISPQDQRLSKRWRLFQVLITFKGQSLSPDQIFKYLSLEESVNPPEALKSLVFQLRKALKGKNSEGNGENYIICSGGTYRFNEDSNYWLDAEEFEILCKKARSKVDSSISEAISLYQEALSLYRGNFLEEVPNAYWAIYAKKHFRDLYLEIMLEANELMMKMEMHKEAWELCEQGLRIVPLEEKLHTMSLQSLLASNKLGLALIQYEEASSLFRENNLSIPGDLKKMGETLKSRLNQDSPSEELIRKLNNYRMGNRPVMSGLEAFSVLYQVEKNRSERRKKPGFLLYLDLRGNAPPEAWERVGKQFEQTLLESLRKGDVICKWGPNNFLALLLNVTPEEIESIMVRLREKSPLDWEKFEIDLENRLQKI